MYRIVLFVISIALFSCVKKGNYTCNCSKNNVLISRETYNDINLRNAKDKCADVQDSYRNLDSIQQNAGVTCLLN